MDKAQYLKTIDHIVAEGHGFEALRDISKLLENNQKNIISGANEIKATHRVIQKIVASDATNRHKCNMIKDILG